MTYVAAGTAISAELAAAVTAAELAAAATAASQAAAATTAATTAAAAATPAAATAAPAITQTAATVLPEVAGTVLPEAGSILQAAPGAVPPTATPLPPAGVEHIGQAAQPLPPAGEFVGPPQGLEQVGGPPLESATLEPVELGSGIEYRTPPFVPEGTTPSAGIEQIAPANQGFTQAELNAIQEGQNLVQTGPSPYYQTASTGETPLVEKAVTSPPNVPTPDASAADVINKALEANTNPFLEGYNSVKNFVKANPFESAIAGYAGLNMMGAFRSPGASPPEKRSYKGQYSLSPNFQGGPYSQPNVYQEKQYNYASGGITSLQGGGGPVERMSQMNTAMNPQGGLYPMGMIDKTQYATPTQRPVSAEMVDEAPAYEKSSPMLMAGGGIARFAKGTPRDARDSYEDFQSYYAMMEGQKPSEARAPSYVGSVGIVQDDDPDTRIQRADVASRTRLKKLAKRSNFGLAEIPGDIEAGTINLAPPGTQKAASGGIMGYNLGGYADGGNPRLLKGPGDGMSDNIPAVIGRRQPARLADGEFVVPADVVSHLGNGSTDAGAKKLHEMMDKVRMARTGKKKQAPAVKPKKYMPA